MEKDSKAWYNLIIYLLEILKIYIDLNYDGLKDAIIQMLAGGRVAIQTERFRNDMTTIHSKDDVLTLLIHLGYLACDSEHSEGFIQNAEIRGECRNAIQGEHWKEVIDALAQSERILTATWNQDEESKKHTCVIEKWER